MPQGNAEKLQLPQKVVVLGHRPFSLVNLYQHARLDAGVHCEGLHLLRRDRRVAFDESRHHTAGCHDASKPCTAEGIVRT